VTGMDRNATTDKPSLVFYALIGYVRTAMS